MYYVYYMFPERKSVQASCYGSTKMRDSWKETTRRREVLRTLLVGVHRYTARCGPFGRRRRLVEGKDGIDWLALLLLLAFSNPLLFLSLIFHLMSLCLFSQHASQLAHMHGRIDMKGLLGKRFEFCQGAV